MARPLPPSRKRRIRERRMAAIGAFACCIGYGAMGLGLGAALILTAAQIAGVL